MMAEIRAPNSVMLIIAVSSRYPAALQWAQQIATSEFGELAERSVAFPFDQTDYYEQSMGPDLKKQFLAFETLIDPGRLRAIKHLTNQWELDYAQQADHVESRPLNLDPGYISEAKLVLASTKDHAHRIYLDEGIYAEVTLHYQAGGWQKLPWTYPDYQQPDFQDFFLTCRKALRAAKRR